MGGLTAIAWRLKNLGLTQKEAEAAIDVILKAVTEGLLKDGKVVLSGFGSFSVRQHRPRSIRLPNAPLRRIPAKKRVHFKASPRLFQPLKQSPA